MLMVGVDGLIKVLRVAGRAVGWSTLVTVGVAGNAVDVCVSAGQWEIGGVVIECCRHPGIFTMTDSAIGRKLQLDVIGVGGLIIVLGVASVAGIRRIVIIPVVAGYTVVGDGGMGPVEGIVVVVNGKSGRHPAGLGSVAAAAVGG